MSTAATAAAPARHQFVPYLTAVEVVAVGSAAAGTELNPRRPRDWMRYGLLPKALSVGRIQFRVLDVMRVVVLLQLQTALGQDSPVATELALSLKDEQLAQLLAEEPPKFIECSTTVRGRKFRVEIDQESLAAARARLAEIPR